MADQTPDPWQDVRPYDFTPLGDGAIRWRQHADGVWFLRSEVDRGTGIVIASRWAAGSAKGRTWLGRRDEP